MTGQPDIQRLVGDIARLGRIVSVDVATHTCRVEIGGIVTGDVPWLAGRAGVVSIWSPPTVGEQCLFLAPEGDAEAGVVLPGLYSDANPPAATASTLTVMRFADGALLSYDHAGHALVAKLPAGGTVTIDAPGGLTFKGDATFTGDATFQKDVAVSGKVTAQDDVLAAGKSLKSHKHGQVAAGGAISGSPL